MCLNAVVFYACGHQDPGLPKICAKMRAHNKAEGHKTTAENWDPKRTEGICGPVPRKPRRDYWLPRRCPRPDCDRPLKGYPPWMTARAAGLTRRAPPGSSSSSNEPSAASSSITNAPPATPAYRPVHPEPETQEYFLPQFTPLNASTAAPTNTPAPTISLRVPPRTIPPARAPQPNTLRMTVRDPNGPPSPPLPGVRRIRIFPYGRDDQPLETMRIHLPREAFGRHVERLARLGILNNPDVCECTNPDAAADAGAANSATTKQPEPAAATNEPAATKEPPVTEEPPPAQENPVIEHSPSPHLSFSPITPPPAGSDSL
ncbi:hypothetical protein MMC07_008875 [Pseudocyphellaria aurata]|nr:hypothetical protein [Pseudocyphellaria aurata]